MGCGGSKVDDQPLVILCRERKELIKTASRHRTALAAAHLAYFNSLRDVGEAIRRFVDEADYSSSSSSPVLTLPSDEGKPSKHNRVSSSPSSTSISHLVVEEDEEGTEEYSHLHLSSGSDSDLESDDDPDQKEESASDYYPPGYSYPVGGWGFTGGYQQGMYYMKKSAPPSRPVIFQPENHRVESNPRWPSESGAGKFGYFGYPPSYNTENQRRTPSPAEAVAVVAPPSPPKVSTWDFLNVFDTYDYNTRGSSYYPSISSSPDSKEVREREGIPELEEEETEHDVVIKQPYRPPRRTNNLEKVKEHKHLRPMPMPKPESSLDSETVSSFSSSDVESEFHHVNEGEGKSGNDSSNGYEMKSSREVEEEYGGRKKGVSFELEETTTTPSFDVESSKMSSLSSLSMDGGTRDLKEVVKEIKNEFEVASSCGKEVALLLEVTKLPYQHRNNNGLKVILSRIMYLIAPSTRSSHSSPELSVRLPSRILKMAKTYDEQEDVNGGFEGNLSSTLEKLYVWEKRLYKEIKDEEKLRAMYEEKCKSLKKMDSYGAESSKFDATRASIRKLLTKIDVCIISVGSISNRIHKLRDEELLPQVTQLIYGLIRMWRSMLKCHQKQFQAIMESKFRYMKAKKDNGSQAILDLEMELREWCISFNDWITTQKSYVQSLSGWLLKCLHYEPEATEDGFATFSPSRIGAPPIFIICKDWQEAMGRISGENVSNAMQGFASSLHEQWEKQEEDERRVKAEDAESERSVVASKGRSESGVSALDDLRVDLDSMRKKLVEERGKRKATVKVVNHNVPSTNLKAGLVPIFRTLRKFTTEVVKAHEVVRLQHPQTSS